MIQLVYSQDLRQQEYDPVLLFKNQGEDTEHLSKEDFLLGTYITKYIFIDYCYIVPNSM